MSDKCESCGKDFIDHLGLIGTCGKLIALQQITRDMNIDIQKISTEIKSCIESDIEGIYYIDHDLENIDQKLNIMVKAIDEYFKDNP